MNSPFKDKNGEQLSLKLASHKIFIRLMNYWLDLKLALLWHPVSYIPSHYIRLFFFRLAGLKIGKKSTIHIGARFYQPNNISIGSGSIIGDHSTLDGRAKLTIGNNVGIASEVMIFNSQHNIYSQEFEPIELPVIIEDFVFIGPRAIILPGVTIGKGAVVAAGAVVTKNVSPQDIVAGVPAKVIANRDLPKLTYQLGRYRLFQ